MYLWARRNSAGVGGRRTDGGVRAWRRGRWAGASSAAGAMPHSCLVLPPCSPVRACPCPHAPAAFLASIRKSSSSYRPRPTSSASTLWVQVWAGGWVAGRQRPPAHVPASPPLCPLPRNTQPASPAAATRAGAPQVPRDARSLLRQPNGLAQQVDVQPAGGLHARPLHLHRHLLPVASQRGAVDLAGVACEAGGGWATARGHVLAGTQAAPITRPTPTQPTTAPTWPSDADAMGCGVIDENTVATGAPNSASSIPKAVAVSKGGTLSCSSESAAAYPSPIRSGRMLRGAGGEGGQGSRGQGGLYSMVRG